METSWTVEGTWAVKTIGKSSGVLALNHGVITLEAEKVTGGDDHYRYDGTYNQSGNRLKAHVHVEQHTAEGAAPLVIVDGYNKYDLEIDGALRDNDTLFASGFVKGTGRKLHVELTRA
jgi:hypothetical protein